MENIQTKPTVSPKDFFLHLGVIVTLYTSAVTFLMFVFTLLDYKLRDVALEQYYYTPSISWPVAMLIVVVPLFILLSWLLGREYRREPLKLELWIRRWLLYITLFLAGIALAGDLITLIYYFLDGRDLTPRFVLKVVSVLIVTAAIFAYHISDLRQTTSRTRNKIYTVVIGVVVLVLIVVGFSITGSPMTQRKLRIDEQIVSDLQNIQWQIVNYWQLKQELPKTLDVLNDPISGYRVPDPPNSGMPYEYQVLKVSAPASFELCATFNLSSPTNNERLPVSTKAVPLGPYGEPINENWQHPAGHHCFERTIDPQLYPPRKG